MNINDYILISSSGEFDFDYYTSKYEIKNCDPIIHFLEEGADKGFNPSPYFNTKFYLESNPDVKTRKINPFIHYLQCGKKEKRRINYKGLFELDNSSFFKGHEDFIFSSSRINDEITQYYNQNYRNKFNYVKFNKDYNTKKEYFLNKNVMYDFFVVPERSIICKKYLPFKTCFLKRNLDLTKLLNFSRFLNHNHYNKKDTRLNNNGGKIFSYQLIHSIDPYLNQDKFEEMLTVSKLYKRVLKRNINAGDETENESIIIDKLPINLNITEFFDDSITLYQNENSFSDSKVIIFHDSSIENIKQYLPFYFKEILFCDESLNEISMQVIKSFKTDYVFEILSEKKLEEYSNNIFNNNFKKLFDNPDYTNSLNSIVKSNNKSINKQKISVIIPVYNTKKYLKQSLDSVFKQNFSNFEVICINDGSTDESLSILEEYVKVNDNLKVFTIKNHGQGFARNMGLNISNGEYIYFLDSDDWINENTLKNLYYKAKSNDLDLLFYQSINYLENNDTYYETDLDNFKVLDDNFGEYTTFNHKDTMNFLFEIPVNPVAKLYKKSFLDNFKIRFPEGLYFEDNAFFYDVYFKCQKAGFLKEKLYNRRVRDGSVTTMINESSFDIIEANNNIIKTFVKNGQYDFYKKDLINHCFDNIFYFFNRFPLELKYKFYEIMLEKFVGFNEYKTDFINNLKNDFLDIYQMMLKNKYFIDYDSEYKLNKAEYIIYDGENYIFKSAREYEINNCSNEYKISVIIPIYNNEKIIHRTLMSIINQSFGIENIEVLLINDCSSDNTKLILDDYAEKYESIKAIHLTKGTGSAGTPRNIGIYESNSDYIMFLDHDDFFELDALEFLYNKMMKNNVDIVYGVWTEIIDNVRYDRIYPELEEGYFRNLNEYEKLIAHPAPSIWTKLFKKSLITENNILFPTILGEDAIFLSKALIKSGGILFYKDKIICHHDLSDESTTNNVTFKYLTEGFISEIYMFNFYRDINKELFYKYRTEGINDFFIGQFLISSLSSDEISRIFNLFKKFCELSEVYDAKPMNMKKRFLHDIILSNDLMATIKFKEIMK